MQMSHFREILIKLALKYISCSLKRYNIQVWIILNGYKVIPFWPLKDPFQATAIIIHVLCFLQLFKEDLQELQ